MKDFASCYNEAPPEVKDFLYSEDFFAFYQEYLKKFEIYDEEKDVQFIYLLQDLAVKALDPSVDNLKSIIMERLGFNEEIASRLLYHIKNKFLPLVDEVWRKSSKGVTQAEPRKEVSPELLDVIKKAKETPPTKLVNLQKITPINVSLSQEIKKEPENLVNLKKIEEIQPQKESLKASSEVSWSPPPIKDTGKAEVVIIKKQPEEKEKKEDVLDLSNL